MKICKKCNINKSEKEFNTNKSKKDNLDIYCKECIKIKAKKYYNEYIPLKAIDIINNKICTLCKEEKNKNLFSKMKSQKDGLNYWCKTCVKIQRSKAEWNINQYNVKKKEWNKYKYNNDLNFKLKSNIRCRMNSILKKQKVYKNNSTIKYLGCSLDFLKTFIENQFTPDMTWENHGIIWEIDHIKPCSKFDLTIEDNIYLCFNYTNLQPLYKSDNRSKGDKINV